VCASCNPTGARPTGFLEGSVYEEHLVDYNETWHGHWIASNIPGWTTENVGAALYQSRYLSNSGRLFFNSDDALAPADVNGTEDVYEYEPAGVGGCQGPDHGQSASDVFVAPAGGCVALLSAGTSPEESAFMDAGESGADVFFITASRLQSQDFDTSIDLYDAHECGAASPCAPPTPPVPPPCTTGDACKAAPTPQPALFGAPSSETFSGAGNVTVTPVASGSSKPKPRSGGAQSRLASALKACRKRPKPRRAACREQARRRYAGKRVATGKSSSATAKR
jgi:hypothetical protein